MRNSFVFLVLALTLWNNALSHVKKQDKVLIVKKSVPIPEGSLLGIRLFDSTDKIVSKHGSPTLISSAEPKKKEGDSEGSDNKDQVIQNIKWIYKKANAQYAFTIAKDGRVLQIECLGLHDAYAITHKKVKLGDEFSKVIKLYGSPENYSLMENYSIARYNSKYHLEFKFANTKLGQPLKVVGIILSSLRPVDIQESDSNKKT